MRNNFYRRSFFHSAKGSTWENHKYIKRINGLYYYPDSYEGGRHLNKGTEQMDIESLEESDVQNLANETIRGNFGNGQVRKEALGAHYQQVQDRVNQILLGDGAIGSSKLSDVSESVKSSGQEATAKAVSKAKGINLDQVYSVYKRQEERKNKKSSSSTTSSSRKKSDNNSGTRYTTNRRVR